MKTAVAAPEQPRKPLRVLMLEDILRRLVEDTDAGCDTYEVRHVVDDAREALGMERKWRRR